MFLLNCIAIYWVLIYLLYMLYSCVGIVRVRDKTFYNKLFDTD